MQVNPSLILWVKHFLQNKSQHVVVNSVKSKSSVINTGVPQGWVLSPLLFSIYTNNANCNDNKITLFKYADDMALVANVKDDAALWPYHQQVNSLIFWIEDSSLELNVSQTKELCCSGRQRVVSLPASVRATGPERSDSGAGEYFQVSGCPTG